MMKFSKPSFAFTEADQRADIRRETMRYVEPGKPTGISLKGIPETRINLKNTNKYARAKIGKTLAMIGEDLLAKSVKVTPIDTGQLRASGVAILSLGPYTTGRGSGGGKVVAQVISPIGESVAGISGGITPMMMKRRVRYVQLNISYSRWGSLDGGQQKSAGSENIEDVALWAHEDLLPYEARPSKPAARTPGTGPKYLEGPFNENISLYEKMLQDALSDREITRDIRGLSKITTKGRKYEVDIIKFNPNSL